MAADDDVFGEALEEEEETETEVFWRSFFSLRVIRVVIKDSD